MLTANAIIARLTPEQRASLPGEWFGNRIVCPKCSERSTVMTTIGDSLVWCRECDGSAGHGKRVPRSHFPERKVYIGPDITDPANLAALLTVCDAVADAKGVRFSTEFFPLGQEKAHCARFGPLLLSRASNSGEGTGPTRTAAALAALDKALGVVS